MVPPPHVQYPSVISTSTLLPCVPCRFADDTALSFWRQVSHWLTHTAPVPRSTVRVTAANQLLGSSLSSASLQHRKKPPLDSFLTRLTGSLFSLIVFFPLIVTVVECVRAPSHMYTFFNMTVIYIPVSYFIILILVIMPTWQSNTVWLTALYGHRMVYKSE